MYKAKVTLTYHSEWTHTVGSSFGEDVLPEEHVTYEFPVEDATSPQMYNAFGKFMLMIGHNEIGVMKGAASVAFNEYRNHEDMKKVADEYDLVLAEDHGEKVIELENKIYAQEQEIRNLKAKLSRLENPYNPEYTEEEIDAMSYENK